MMMTDIMMYGQTSLSPEGMVALIFVKKLLRSFCLFVFISLILSSILPVLEDNSVTCYNYTQVNIIIISVDSYL
jgi:hypothetical protein